MPPADAATAAEYSYPHALSCRPQPVPGRLAVTLKPSMWGGGHEHQGAGVMFVIAEARESRIAGAALFPEILKAEFHGIRSVLEAYSRGASIEGMKEPHAAGVMLTKDDKSWNATVRVWSAGRSLDYRLDRWD